MCPLVGYNINDFRLKRRVEQAIRGLRRKGGGVGIAYRQYVTLSVVNKLTKPRTQVYRSARLAGIGKSLHKVAV